MRMVGANNHSPLRGDGGEGDDLGVGVGVVAVGVDCAGGGLVPLADGPGHPGVMIRL